MDEPILTLGNSRSFLTLICILLCPYHSTDIRVWEILAELVKLNTRPSPSNPFAVDLQYFDSLDIGERVIALGAMSHLLQQIFSHGPDKAYAGLGKLELYDKVRWMKIGEVMK